MMDKQHDMYVFTCDECGDVIEPGRKTFHGSLQELKSEGWIVIRNDADNDWLHICSNCSKIGKLKQK